MKVLNLSDDAPWKQRMRAPIVGRTQVAFNNPERGLVVSNQSGVYQLHTWDVKTGKLRQLTDTPAGEVFGGISPDGKYIYRLLDTKGDEIGHYVRIPFDGGEPEDITPMMEPYASFSISQSLDSSRLGFTTADQSGFQIYAMSIGTQGALGTPELVYHSASLSNGPTFSYEGDYAVIATTERSQHKDYALMAFYLNCDEQNQTVKVLQDEDASIRPIAFAPLPADTRLLAVTDVTGFDRPVIWDVKTGDRVDLPLPEIEGNISAWDWSPDGHKLLLSCLNQATYQLYTYDLETSILTKLDHPSGSFSSGYFTPNADEIFVNWQSACQPSQVIALDAATGQVKRTVLAAGEAPEGIPWRSVTFPSADHTQIQAWVATPEGNGPFPTILHTHGGPSSVTTEVFNTQAQAWLDHGFAWMSVNYRGSITFGREFESAIFGLLGIHEVDDMAAGYQWLVDNDIALPDSVLLTGGSYGGYLTLQALGRRPDLWAGGMAIVAIADWTLMYEDMAETLRGYQRSLFGGTPDQLPEQYATSSPMTYVDDLNAPILVIQGQNDTRCPARQMQVYEERLKASGKNITLEWFDAGHGSRAMDENIRQMELMLRFAYRTLG